MKKFLMICTLFAFFSCGTSTQKVNNKLEYVAGSYFVYYDNETLQIPKGSYITNDMRIEDYFFNFFGTHVKDKKKLLSDLSRYFPHGIDDVVSSNVKPISVVQIPTMTLNDNKIIDSIRLSHILLKEDGKALLVIDDSSDLVEVKQAEVINPEVSLEGRTVDILNANGINKFASRLGEAFKQSLNMNYNAENYERRSDMSYVINHNLTDDEFLKFVNSISIKYIKIKEDPNLRHDSDVVIITGNDKKVKYDVNIYTKTGASELKEILEEYNAKVYKAHENAGIVSTVIKYNKEDFVIAHKLLSLIPSAKLEEDNSLKNKINIMSNR